MSFILNENELKRLALIGPKSKYISLFKNKKKIGSLYIQKQDLFPTNLYSSIQRLKNDEVEEIKYSPADNEVISITMINNERYLITYHSTDVIKIDALKKEIKLKFV